MQELLGSYFQETFPSCPAPQLLMKHTVSRVTESLRQLDVVHFGNMSSLKVLCWWATHPLTSKFLKAGQRAQVEQESFFLIKLCDKYFCRKDSTKKDKKKCALAGPKNHRSLVTFLAFLLGSILSQESQEDIGGVHTSRRFHSNHGTSTAAHVVNDPQFSWRWAEIWVPSSHR